MDESSNRYAPEPRSGRPELPGEASTAPAGPATLRKVFVGADGLRAGWSLTLFILILAALSSAVTFIGHSMRLLPPAAAQVRELSLRFGLYSEGLQFLMTFLAAWIMSKIEKRPNSVYGLGGPRALSNFLSGLGWGITCLSLLVFMLWKTGLLAFDRRLLFGGAAVRYGLVWFLVFLMVGFFEEYLTRGYVLYTLTRGLSGTYSWLFKTHHSKALGFWTAAILLSALFGIGHKQNQGESPIGVLAAGLAGLVFCSSLWRTGSLWWAIGFHATWDWAQSFLYGVPDSGLMVQHHLQSTHALGIPLMSGGATGPEGSIFVLPMLLLVSCVALFTLPRGSYGHSIRVQADKHPR